MKTKKHKNKESSLVFQLAEELPLLPTKNVLRAIKKDCYNSEASICFRSEKPLSKIL